VWERTLPAVSFDADPVIRFELLAPFPSISFLVDALLLCERAKISPPARLLRVKGACKLIRFPRDGAARLTAFRFLLACSFL